MKTSPRLASGPLNTGLIHRSGGTSAAVAGFRQMITEREALARIERSVQQYLGHCITRGEAVDDVIESLEASGRLLEGDVLDGEPRSWAPTAMAKSRKASRARAEPARSPDRAEARA